MKDFSPTTLVAYLKIGIISILFALVALKQLAITEATALGLAFNTLLSAYGFKKAADAPPGPKADGSE